MRNRKIVVIAFILAAVLAIGVGYAAFTTALFINGTTEISDEVVEFTGQINFTKAYSNDVTYGHAWVGEEDPTTEENPHQPEDGSAYAGFHVFGMTVQGQRVQFTYTIENGSDTDVDLTIKATPGTNTEYFAVTTSIGGDTVRVAAGTSTTVSVTVLLLKDADGQSVDPTSWSIEYTATQVEEEETTTTTQDVQ